MDNNKLVDSLMEQDLLELSFFINNRCNLSCKHCYLANKGGTSEGEDLSLEKWKSVLDEAISLGVKSICIAGGEPLLTPDRTFGIIRSVVKDHDDVSFGLVTNGTLLPNYADEISRLGLGFIDISVDGIEKEHDFIRGDGNFKRALLGIRALVASGFPKEKIFISTTLTSKTSLFEMIIHLHKEGISNFFVSPYLKLEHTSEELVIDDFSCFDRFVEKLGDFPKGQNINVFVRTDHATLDLLNHLLRKGHIDLLNVQKDKAKNIYFTRRKIGGVNLLFSMMPYHTELIREVRITNDGYVVYCLDQGTKDYKEKSLGNVMDLSLKEILGSKNAKEKIRSNVAKSVLAVKETLGEIPNLF